LRISDLKISISGIRGIVGESLTPQLIIKFAEAFSTYIGGGTIAVGSDTRPSAEMVKNAVFAGLLSCGASPLDLGILPIPSLQIYTKEKKLDGAISITASHNPVEWNALKLIRKGGHYLYPYEAEELLDVYYQGRFQRVESPDKIDREDDPFSIHKDKIMGLIDTEMIRQKKLRVVVDPCGGAASPFVQDFLESLGTEVICVNCGLTEGFPRNPEPIPKNLRTLCEAVKEHKADVGFAQDADADRLAAVDENGVPIGEEYTLALAVDYYLQRKKKSPVVVNLSTSRVIEDITKKAGVELFRSLVGEINVARMMEDKDAKIGGEGNGGIMIADVHTCRDSFAGMAYILEYLAWSGKKLSELRKELPDYFMIKHKVKASFRQARVILNKISKKFKEGQIQTLDGLRVDYPDFWLHVRPSNTEPVVRIQVEGKSEESAQKVFKQIMEEI
jgi:phosphomannomutase